MVCLGDEQRSFCHFWDCIQVLHFWLFCWPWWLIHSSEGFLPIVLTEAEDIKKRWQEYTEERYKKDLHDLDNHDGVITHLEPNILECEVKWALESITTNKASGGDGIPVELFWILKDDAVKVLHSICQQIWKTAESTGLEKFSFHSNPKEGQLQRMFKLLHNCIHFIC